MKSQDGLAGSLGRGWKCVKRWLRAGCRICTTSLTREGGEEEKGREKKRREERRRDKDNAETQSTLSSAEKNREMLSAAAGDASLRVRNKDSRRRFPWERKAGEIEQTEWRRARLSA